MTPKTKNQYYWKRVKTRKWWKENAYWFFRYGLWRGIRDMPKHLRAFFQRGYRGYADRDLWSLDSYLCDFMPEALRKLAGNLQGHPMLLAGEDYDDERDFENTFEAWKDMLNTMADGFAAHRELLDKPWLEDSPRIGNILEHGEWDDWYDKRRENFHAREEELIVIRDEGLALFVKYFGALWD